MGSTDARLAAVRRSKAGWNLETSQVPRYQYQIGYDEDNQGCGNSMLEISPPRNPVAGSFSHGYADNVGGGTDGGSIAADIPAQ